MKEKEINNLDDVLKIINKQHDEIVELRRQNDWLKRQLFGVKSEKMMSVSDDTPDLFAAESSPVAEPPQTEPVAAHERKKTR